jgi:hypothetical protein
MPCKKSWKASPLGITLMAHNMSEPVPEQQAGFRKGVRFFHVQVAIN